jgi:hypothetical protein
MVLPLLSNHEAWEMSYFSASYHASHLTALTGRMGPLACCLSHHRPFPLQVAEAVVLPLLSYQEAWEMSYFGANVLHPRTTLPAMKYSIPITIRNVFNQAAPGTKIWKTALPEVDGQEHLLGDGVVKGFATIDNVALINVEG